MKHTILASFAALCLCAWQVPAQAGSADAAAAPEMEMLQRAADHAAMLDAAVAGLKAGLKLTPEQEQLWPPFEAAVRAGAAAHMQAMAAMMGRMKALPGMKDGEMGEKGMPDMDKASPPSPADRLDAIAGRLSARGAALKKIADAAGPFYASLDPSQRRLFGLLGGEALMMGHGRPVGMMGPMGGGAGPMGAHGMGGAGGMHGSGGMGRMEHGMGGMMGSQPKGEGDDSGDE